MSNYVQNPNDSQSLVPGPPSDKMFSNTNNPGRNAFTKAPNYVYITADLSNDIGFFYKSSGSFAQTGAPDASTTYDNWGAVTGGTRLDIHPTAWSGSVADAAKVRFVYNGGLDGSGR